MIEYLVEIELNFPPEPNNLVDERKAQEAARARQLRAEGTIVRIWRVPGRRANVGIWRAEDPTALHNAVASLPLFPYMDVRVVPLADHYVEQDLAHGEQASG